VKKRKVLVIDIGGTHVKLMISPRERRKFDSGPRMTPAQGTRKIKQAVRGWDFDAVSIGFPAPVRNGHIMRDPKHLGPGWSRFFRLSVRVAKAGPGPASSGGERHSVANQDRGSMA